MSKRPLVSLIDDDEWLTAQYVRLLESGGFEARSVTHALDGIDAIDRLRPSVIVLDMFMPGPNGMVLLHEIRSHSDLAQIPIILCTNSASDLDPKSIAAYGVRAILDKTTMKPEDVLTKVRALT